ncbi:MAG: cytochrome C552 [Gammaproteobacteria bacterium]|nr:cytochrome C552 [Gammaproteobacteria bacterium]
MNNDSFVEYCEEAKKMLGRRMWILLALAMMFGIIVWGGFNTVMELTNTTEFCISCHEMEDNVYNEYVGTIHDANRSGVRAGCPDCHVPKPWIHKIVRKIKASNEVYHKILGTINTPEKFDAKRLQLASNVWRAMKETDSRECRNCHDFDTMDPSKQKPRARKQHANAMLQGNTCIDCHKGIAHKDVRKQLPEDELEALEAPDPHNIRKLPKNFTDGMERVAQAEAEQEKKDKEAKTKAKAKKIAAEEAVQARIKKAVEAALKSAGNGGSTAAPEASSEGSGVNWGPVPEREIVIFYPGQTSIEWVLNGKDHGGARPILKGGDRCTTCHDKETADMGKKMVTGEKAEPTPMPDKRGHIPVKVQAAHDAENLFLRFEWEDTTHVPVPFVDGGKMDPENPMKIAVMLATDEVEYADRGGCWGTCHHDVDKMPHQPEADAISASDAAKRLDLSKGITKYIKESRTKLEIKGRRGKKRGGWDKLKEDGELKAELDTKHFMDLLRYKSGQKVAEDGHILDQRIMSGGQGFNVNARKEGNNWIVEMSRKLKSDKPGDLSLELDKVYNIGFAIHDDHTNGRYHHVSLGYRMAFDKEAEGIEINATKQ